jgi:hypothetical protein
LSFDGGGGHVIVGRRVGETRVGLLGVHYY